MKIIKENKAIISFLIGVIISGGIVYAASSASRINYETEN